MSYRIPDEFVQSVLSRADLVGIVSQRMTLKKSAQNYMARCPFHTEKTPSFSVNQLKQFFYCFGCHANGDAIEFIMRYDGISFVEAIESLANQLGLPLPKQGQSDELRTEEQALYIIISAAGRYFQQALRTHSQAPKAIEYLKSRGLTGQIAKQFNLGFAPDGWDGFLNYCKQNNLSIEMAIASGLIVQKDGGHCYDRFRDRIIFPIHNVRGQLLGFGGRVISGGEPKYLNSPESPVFNKGQELYGLYQAKAKRNLAQIIVVEGYLDVISLSQFGVDYAVASLGTALTQKHLDLIFRYTNEVVFCFDGDRPGRDAAKRALHLALPLLDAKKRLRFLLLSEKEDPDSFIRMHGLEAFKRQINASISIIDYLFQVVCENEETTSIEGRARIINGAKPLIDSVRSRIFRDMLYERLAQLVRLDRESLQPNSSTSTPFRKGEAPRFTPKRIVPAQNPLSPAQRALATLLKRPDLANNIGDLEPLRQLSMAGIDLLCQVVPLLQAEPNLTLSQLAARVRPRYQAELHLPELSHFANIIPASGMEQEFQDALSSLETTASEVKMETLLAKASEGTLSIDEKALLRRLLQNKDVEK